jgi:hypothetical protein
MHQARTVERSAEQWRCADPDPLAMPDNHGSEEAASGGAETLSSTIAAGSGVAVLCVLEGAWFWLLATGAVWLFGGE